MANPAEKSGTSPVLPRSEIGSITSCSLSSYSPEKLRSILESAASAANEKVRNGNGPGPSSFRISNNSLQKPLYVDVSKSKTLKKVKSDGSGPPRFIYLVPVPPGQGSTSSGVKVKPRTTRKGSLPGTLNSLQIIQLANLSTVDHTEAAVEASAYQGDCSYLKGINGVEKGDGSCGNAGNDSDNDNAHEAMDCVDNYEDDGHQSAQANNEAPLKPAYVTYFSLVK